MIYLNQNIVRDWGYTESHRENIENHRENTSDNLCGSHFKLCGSLCNLSPENKNYLQIHRI